MNARWTLISSMAAIACALTSQAGEAAQPATCASLAKELRLPDTTILLAEETPAGAFKPPAGGGMGGPPAVFASLPAFCRVAGTIRPTADSDIRFEAWLPLTGWNGKFVGGGNGVWAGSIAYGDMVGPLAAGYATAASDVGHQGNPLDGSFLVGHPEKLIDFGHRATHLMTVNAKAAVEAFYGRRPQRSLYVSCSTGGRIGLMEAWRYPEDYDGISAMAPANPMVPLMALSLWTGHVAMKDEASRIPPPKFQLARGAAMAACDADDGAKDGIISHPAACRFDPAVLQCKGADAADCLTAPQVATLRAIYAGPKNPRTGRQIYPGLAVGSEAQMPALTSGTEPFPVATTFFRGPVFNDPKWDFRSFDYDRDVERALAYGSDALDVPPTGLNGFFAGNRKLLLSHGWADGLIPAQSTIDFFQALRRDIGARRADRNLRLFMAPGVGHCAGGDAPSRIDHLGILDRWVETGSAPERIVASNPPGMPVRTRPLCAHPKLVKYSGSGSTDDERSFRCD
jgi:hypothetical protein